MFFASEATGYSHRSRPARRRSIRICGTGCPCRCAAAARGRNRRTGPSGTLSTSVECRAAQRMRRPAFHALVPLLFVVRVFFGVYPW